MAPPTTYTKAKGAALCRLMAEGMTFTAACADQGIPTSTAYDWLEAQPEFADAYERARKVLAHVSADNAIAAARDAKDAGLGRLQFDALRWHAGKLHYAAYGEKLNLDHSGEVKTALDWSKVGPQALRQIRAALRNVEPEGSDDGA